MFTVLHCPALLNQMQFSNSKAPIKPQLPSRRPRAREAQNATPVNIHTIPHFGANEPFFTQHTYHLAGLVLSPPPFQLSPPYRVLIQTPPIHSCHRCCLTHWVNPSLLCTRFQHLLFIVFPICVSFLLFFQPTFLATISTPFLTPTQLCLGSISPRLDPPIIC